MGMENLFLYFYLGSKAKIQTFDGTYNFTTLQFFLLLAVYFKFLLQNSIHVEHLLCIYTFLKTHPVTSVNFLS